MTMSKSDEENHRRPSTQHINDISALNAAMIETSAHQSGTKKKKEEDGWDRKTGQKMKTNRQALEQSKTKTKKINFIVKLRKLLCIFGQSFRLSSINCRYYWAIAFIIFIESFSSSFSSFSSLPFFLRAVRSLVMVSLFVLVRRSSLQLKDDHSRYSVTQHTVYERIYYKI